MKQPLASLNLPSKFALALVSAGSYGLLTFVSERSAALDAVFSKANSGMHLVALIFGALVMAPYVAQSDRWPLRAAAMCVASAVSYYLAVRFVTDGPIGYDMVLSFILAGGGAALLSGLAVVLIAPRAFSWKLVLLTVVAGAVGGAIFDLKFSFDPNLLVGHAVWQLLVCLALNFSFREAPT